MGLRRSSYGSLAARMMKVSMHGYWHAGHAEPHAAHLGNPMEKDAQPHTDSWLERKIHWLAELEEARFAPTSNVSISKAHHRYLDATANWQLRVAYRLDPGDAALYEILHYTVMARAATPELARLAAERLAAQTIECALSEQGGMSSALTGAGAAINLLNNDMMVGSGIGPELVRQHWETLLNCLKRYRALRNEAVALGWWEAVPLVRRGEITSYAGLVEKISGTIGRRLLETGVLIPQTP